MYILLSVKETNERRDHALGEKRRGLYDLMARSELAIRHGMFQESGELSPSAAYNMALTSTGDKELAKSCRFAAILHRDYGQEVARLVAESNKKEATTMADLLCAPGSYVSLTTSVREIRAFVGDDGKYVVNKEIAGWVLGEKDGYIHMLGRDWTTTGSIDLYVWFQIKISEVVVLTPSGPPSGVSHPYLQEGFGKEYLPKSWTIGVDGQASDQQGNKVPIDTFLKAVWQGRFPPEPRVC